MRRASAVAAIALLLAVLVELVVVTLGEERASAALCDVDVDLRPPVALRVLADRWVPFTARLDGDDLDRLVPRPDVIRSLDVRDGRLRLETTAGPTVPADLRLDHGRLLVTPALGPLDLDRLTLRIPLVDVLPIGLEVDGVAVEDDVVRVTGRADAREFTGVEPGRACPGEVS